MAPELRAARSTYLTQCSQCHGTDANGTAAAANLRAFKGTEDDFLRITRNGRAGTGMTPWKGLISDGAVAGHAAAVEPSAVAALAADVAHLLASGLWAGALLPLALLLRAASREDGADARPYAVVTTRRFSTLALSMVIVLLVSGALAAWETSLRPSAREAEPARSPSALGRGARGRLAARPD